MVMMSFPLHRQIVLSRVLVTDIQQDDNCLKFWFIYLSSGKGDGFMKRFLNRYFLNLEKSVVVASLWGVSIIMQGEIPPDIADGQQFYNKILRDSFKQGYKYKQGCLKINSSISVSSLENNFFLFKIICYISTTNY